MLKSWRRNTMAWLPKFRFAGSKAKNLALAWLSSQGRRKEASTSRAFANWNSVREWARSKCASCAKELVNKSGSCFLSHSRERCTVWLTRWSKRWTWRQVPLKDGELGLKKRPRSTLKTRVRSKGGRFLEKWSRSVTTDWSLAETPEPAWRVTCSDIHMHILVYIFFAFVLDVCLGPMSLYLVVLYCGAGAGCNANRACSRAFSCFPKTRSNFDASFGQGLYVSWATHHASVHSVGPMSSARSLRSWRLRALPETTMQAWRQRKMQWLCTTKRWQASWSRFEPQRLPSNGAFCRCLRSALCWITDGADAFCSSCDGKTSRWTQLDHTSNGQIRDWFPLGKSFTSIWLQAFTSFWSWTVTKCGDRTSAPGRTWWWKSTTAAWLVVSQVIGTFLARQWQPWINTSALIEYVSPKKIYI